MVAKFGPRDFQARILTRLMQALSVFNFNLELAAPECTFEQWTFELKWFSFMLLPAVAMALLLVWTLLRMCLAFATCKRPHAGYRYRALSGWGGTCLTLLYFMHLPVSRVEMEPVNCSPTDPPDGHSYMAAVFERCWQYDKDGEPGLQLRLYPFAIAAITVYVAGIPALFYVILTCNKARIMDDQKLVAKF